MGNTYRSATAAKNEQGEKPFASESLRQGPARFSREGPDAKCFRLCKPRVVSVLYSFFLLFYEPLKIYKLSLA